MLIKSFGKQLSKKLTHSESNIVLSPVSPGSQPVAYLECRQPIVIWTDATFAGAMKTHSELSPGGLCKETIRDAIANERAALERCSLAIYMSDWAAQSAINAYKLDPRKVRVVPPGANLECALMSDEVEAVVGRRSPRHCKLLFIATRWKPKGGDVAVEVARALNEAGLTTTLTVVGTRPDHSAPLPPFVHLAGTLRKWIPQDLAALERLLREAHFLILPTRAEGAPGAVCEASAFAVPSLVSDVCGVASAVSERNGALFPLNASADAYCSFIERLFCDYGQYKELARSSFREFTTRLNWESAATAVRSHMIPLLDSSLSSAAATVGMLALAQT
jgi:glycosyltransferase involved in cell wall biosynthesis